MKTTSKLIAAILIVTAILFTSTVKAQTMPANAWRLGIGLEVADPTGNARAGSNFVLGGTARLQYGLSDNFALTLTRALIISSQSTFPGLTLNITAMALSPLKPDLRHFLRKTYILAQKQAPGLRKQARAPAQQG